MAFPLKKIFALLKSSYSLLHQFKNLLKNVIDLSVLWETRKKGKNPHFFAFEIIKGSSGSSDFGGYLRLI